MRQVTDDAIQEMVEALVRAADRERIVLFGSHARGDADAESDVDLLVIESEAFGPHRSRREELARLYRVLRRMGVAKDILLYSAEGRDECCMSDLKHAELVLSKAESERHQTAPQADALRAK